LKPLVKLSIIILSSFNSDTIWHTPCNNSFTFGITVETRWYKSASISFKPAFKKEPDLMKIIDAIDVKEGFAAEEILQTAEKLDCDAIVMGSHGKGILHNTFLGSTSKQVLRRTRLPVFNIPIPKGQIDISFQDE